MKSYLPNKRIYGTCPRQPDKTFLKLCFYLILIYISFSNYRVPVLLSNEISSHLIEKILHVVTPELWQEIYDSYFNNHLVQLSSHPIANFIVQHLMASTTDKSQVSNSRFI